MNEISLPENDFFRDPEIWKILILEIIPSVLKQKDHVHIYFPDFCSGIEIISLLILLKDYNLSPKVRIYADTFTLKQLQNIECRQFSKEMFNYYRDNYKNVNPDFELSDNFISIGKFFNINPVIYNEISLNLSEHKLNTQIPNILYDIIIYRNKLLYYNIDYCNSIINQLSDNLEINGFFITGTKDILLNRNFSNRLKLINFEERIYIKIK
ncbi:MAG: CheR family methyltransferase [Bacteroidota bacterium]